MGLERFGEFRIVTLRKVAREGYGNGDAPQQIADYYHSQIAPDVHHNRDLESIYGVVLSARRRIQGHYLVAQGLLDSILAHAREVFRPAIVANAAAIVVLHNHPSGDTFTNKNENENKTRNRY